MPNLSISSPLDALRTGLMLENIRRKQEQQIKENQRLLDEMGKRRKRDNSRSVAAAGAAAEAQTAVHQDVRHENYEKASAEHRSDW